MKVMRKELFIEQFPPHLSNQYDTGQTLCLISPAISQIRTPKQNAFTVSSGSMKTRHGSHQPSRLGALGSPGVRCRAFLGYLQVYRSLPFRSSVSGRALGGARKLNMDGTDWISSLASGFRALKLSSFSAMFSIADICNRRWHRTRHGEYCFGFPPSLETRNTSIHCHGKVKINEFFKNTSVELPSQKMTGRIRQGGGHEVVPLGITITGT